MKILVAIALGLALACGCDQQTGPEPNRGVTPPGRGGAPAPGVPEPAKAPSSGPSWQRRETAHPARPFTMARPPEPGAAPHPPGSPSAEPQAQRAGSAEAERRDLGAELHAAVGNPAGCLASSSPEQLPDRISMNVTAEVSSTGIVTRADVSGSSLPREVVRCVQSRVEAAQLQGPIANAPVAVHTTLTFERH